MELYLLIPIVHNLLGRGGAGLRVAGSLNNPTPKVGPVGAQSNFFYAYVELSPEILIKPLIPYFLQQSNFLSDFFVVKFCYCWSCKSC